MVQALEKGMARCGRAGAGEFGEHEEMEGWRRSGGSVMREVFSLVLSYK